MGMRFSARKNVYVDFGGMAGRSSSQTRRNAREILHAAAAIFHAVQSAVRSSKKLFGGVAIFRKRGDAGAHGECRRFGLGGQSFPNAADNAGGHNAARLRQKHSKFLS